MIITIVYCHCSLVHQHGNQNFNHEPHHVIHFPRCQETILKFSHQLYRMRGILLCHNNFEVIIDSTKLWSYDVLFFVFCFSCGLPFQLFHKKKFEPLEKKYYTSKNMWLLSLFFWQIIQIFWIVPDTAEEFSGEIII